MEDHCPVKSVTPGNNVFIFLIKKAHCAHHDNYKGGWGWAERRRHKLETITVFWTEIIVIQIKMVTEIGKNQCFVELIGVALIRQGRAVTV